MRRKLTLSYIFIGFVPALLIIAFFLLSGLLLFFNISSYMLRTRLSALVDDTRFLAQSAALELQRAGGIGEMAADAELAGRRVASRVSLASRTPSVPAQTRVQRSPSRLRASPMAEPDHPPGRGRTSTVPSRVPSWIPCEGHAGLVIVRTEGLRSERCRARRRAGRIGANYVVIVDVPLGEQLVRELQADTGITLRNITALENLGPDPPTPIEGTGAAPDGATPPYQIIVGPANVALESNPAGRFTLGHLHRVSPTGTRATRGTLTASFRLAPTAVWERISARR